MMMGPPDSAFAGRGSQKSHAGADLRSHRDTGLNYKPEGASGARRSGSRGVTASAPRPQPVPAPRPDTKPMLTQDAYIKRQQLRWLLKKRLGQVRDALTAMQNKGAQRTPASLQTDPEPTPGLFLPTIKGDFEQSFSRPLSYKEFGVERLGQLLLRECDDILQEPVKISQFMPMVCCRMAPHLNCNARLSCLAFDRRRVSGVQVQGQSTVPSGGEAKAAARMAGRQNVPVLQENTCMHVTKVLRHYGYSTEDVAAYAKTLPQPKSKAEKAQKAAKQAAAVGNEAQANPSATVHEEATAAAKGKDGAGGAGGTKRGQSQPANGPVTDAIPRGNGSAHADAPKESNRAAVYADADAVDTLAASNANVLGMASDDEDAAPAEAVAPVAAGLVDQDGTAGTKRKAADMAGASNGRSGVLPSALRSLVSFPFCPARPAFINLYQAAQVHRFSHTSAPAVFNRCLH